MECLSSVAGLPIRLMDERWRHIQDEHAGVEEMRGTILDVVARPDAVLAGNHVEVLAASTRVDAPRSLECAVSG